MRQAATGEVCVGPGRTAPFTISVPSTASFDRLLPAERDLPLRGAGQKRDPAG